MSKEEVCLELPWDVIDAGRGLSLDIGGSLIKVLYLHREDWVESSNRQKNIGGHLRLVSFEGTRLDEAISLLKKNGHIIRNNPEETVEIYITGQAGSHVIERLKSELNIRCRIATELDCFIHSFMYLAKNLSRKELLFDLEQSVYDGCRKTMLQFYNMAEQMKEMTTAQQSTPEKPELHDPKPYTRDHEKPITEEAGIFPCILYVSGAASGAILVNEDGTFSAVDGSQRGGGTFSGLGSLLTGAKTYEELIELAERGNSFKVGVSNLSMGEGMNNEEDSAYALITNSDDVTEKMAFFFGRAVGKTLGDYEKQDLANSLLEMTAHSMVQSAHYTCMLTGVKNIFFVGSFMNSHPVRKYMTEEWLARDVIMTMFLNQPIGTIPCHFLKHGSHLGALGAYLKD